MSMKKFWIVLTVALAMLLCACDSQSQATQPVDTPTIPQTPSGVVTDSVPRRFAQQGEILYFSAGDSILSYRDGAMELLCTADAPDYLFVSESNLIHREVQTRGDDNSPEQYKVVSRSVDNAEAETLLFYGEILWVYVYGETVWMMTSAGDLVAVPAARGEMQVFQLGMTDIPSAWEQKLYFTNGSAILCMDLETKQQHTVLEKNAALNLFAYEKNIYFSTEESSVLENFDIETGVLSQHENVPCIGLNGHEGKLYYVQNSEGTFELRCFDGTQIAAACALGALQVCSEPYFADSGIYFYIGSDDYYGLVFVDAQGRLTKLETSEG